MRDAGSDETPVIAREGASRLAAALTAGVFGLFGLTSLVAGIDRMLGGRVDADDVVLLIFGALFTFGGWRVWRFTTGPRMVVTKDALWVSRFVGGTTYRFSEIEALGLYGRQIKTNARGGVGRLPYNLRLGVLVVVTAQGKVREHTLPGENRGAVLEALRTRSGISLEELRDGKEAPKDFGDRLR